MITRRLPIALLVLAALAATTPAVAQDAETNAALAEIERQFNPKEAILTEDQVVRFIALRKAEKVVREKLQDNSSGTVLNMARIERKIAEEASLIPKHGFDPKGDYIDIRWTIDKLTSAFDYDTNEYFDPVEKWKQRVAEAEKSAANPISMEGLTEEELAQIKKSNEESVGYMKDALKQSQTDAAPRNPDNIALVKKYIKDLRSY
jgi:hypothetical protein